MNLPNLQNAGLKLKKDGNFENAIKIFEQIIEENPNYEFGVIFYEIASCYEKLNDFKQAREYYLKSIEYDDEDEKRLIGYAAFLFRHGDPKESLQWYLKALAFNKKWKMDYTYLLQPINVLAERIGLTEHELSSMIKNI